MTDLHIGVLALQGDFREHNDALAAIGVQTSLVRTAEELAAVDGLVIPGGESTTMLHLLRVFELWAPLHAAVQAGLPIYGSCAGMIMLAADIEAGRAGQVGLGALDITVRRNAFGRQSDSFEQDLTVAKIAGPPLRAVFIRAPWVERVGPAVEVLATVTVNGQERAVAVQHGPVLATSFHPEITGDHRIHQYFVDLVRSHRR